MWKIFVRIQRLTIVLPTSESLSRHGNFYLIRLVEGWKMCKERKRFHIWFRCVFFPLQTFPLQKEVALQIYPKNIFSKTVVNTCNTSVQCLIITVYFIVLFSLIIELAIVWLYYALFVWADYHFRFILKFVILTTKYRYRKEFSI